ncbi:uncharacterized protein DNG_07240 [Cephalotrichum gorgonifer]|uniref:HNH nuclease domain-containing protein n=1 Tax=Cephalotrichum gorgonifer TaxID=2041049 RepID=A0AAE8N490_9PEZI|nr:uncharacterized protein DNG_07240 [Cephalotrichum gorgonifer]
MPRSSNPRESTALGPEDDCLYLNAGQEKANTGTVDNLRPERQVNRLELRPARLIDSPNQLGHPRSGADATAGLDVSIDEEFSSQPLPAECELPKDNPSEDEAGYASSTTDETGQSGDEGGASEQMENRKRALIDDTMAALCAWLDSKIVTRTQAGAPKRDNDTILDGFTKAQERQLKSRKKTEMNRTDEGKWREMYLILFPDDDPETIPSPYQPDADVIPDTAVSGSATPADFAVFARRELPHFVRSELETLLESDFPEMEERMRSMNARAVEQTTPRLTIFRGWLDPGKHVWSPFVIKLEARLRFASVIYNTASGSPMTAPRGKIPYVECRGPPPPGPEWVVREDGGETVSSLGDSTAIIKALVNSGVIPDINAGLSGEKKAYDMALRALLEDNLYFYHTRERWIDNYYTMRDHALCAIPYPVRVAVGILAHRKHTAMLDGQGTGRFTSEEAKAHKVEIWENINRLLQTSKRKCPTAAAVDGEPFWALGGSEPTEADATIFGFIVSVLICTAGPESGKIVRGFPVVVEYARRIHNRYFLDYEQWEAQGGRRKNPLTPEDSPSEMSCRRVVSFEAEIETSGRDEQERLRELCLQRDNFGCVITGYADWDSILNKRTVIDDERGATHTELAHIFPLALAKLDEGIAAETDSTAMIWEALYRYFPQLEGKVVPGSINSPKNAMTMSSDHHKCFGSFQIALEPENKQGEYRLKYFIPETGVRPKERISLPGTEEIKPPDPDILGGHYAIATIRSDSP